MAGPLQKLREYGVRRQRTDGHKAGLAVLIVVRLVDKPQQMNHAALLL